MSTLQVKDGLDQRRIDFIEWLVDPTRSGSQNEYAKRIGVDHATLSKWKKESIFRTAWEKRLAELNVSPDRMQEVINAMHGRAVRGDVQAAKLYLQYVDRFQPTTRVVVDDRAAKEMSDEELATALEDNVVLLRHQA